MQQQRFERKYFLTAELAVLVRGYVRCYLEPDEFSVGKPEFAYPVHSLYLDSDELATYWATVHCEKSRFKLRVRFYDGEADSPLFFEIKQRINECILKRRGTVHRSAGHRLLAGHLPEPGDLLSSRPGDLAALQKFCHLMHLLNAHPRMHIAYDREAWVSPGSNAVRVTMDRRVRGEERFEPRFKTEMIKPVFPFREQWVLEIKFTNRFPDWLSDMVRCFDLVQSGAPKYCGSLDDVGVARVVRGAGAGKLPSFDEAREIALVNKWF